MTNLLLAANTTSSIIWIVVLIGMIVLMMVMPSISRKKQIQAYNEMQSRLKAGDKVQTIGGIVGRIVRIKESNGTKTIFIETGDKNNKMVIEFDANAIAGVVEGLHTNCNCTDENHSSADLEAEVLAEAENFDVSFDEESSKETTEEKKPETKRKSSKSKK